MSEKYSFFLNKEEEKYTKQSRAQAHQLLCKWQCWKFSIFLFGCAKKCAEGVNKLCYKWGDGREFRGNWKVDESFKVLALII